MSWINSNATYKQNSKNDLSFYHGFSKTPVEPTSTGTAATTLANASTKGGHTVIGTEVWAEEIPWFGLVASRAAAVTRLSGLTKLNDLVKVDGEGGKVYRYIGADDAVFTEAEWSSFWTEVTLTNGMVLNNRHNQPVLRYYLNQPMQTLTTTNNASIDSKGFATRLFVNEENHTGQTSGGSVISQFAAGTDNIKNGIPSVELNPKLYLGTTEKIAGTHYYDYNVSGTILWSTAVTSSSPKISCFRYIGKTVTGQLSTVEEAIKGYAIDISDIKAALGLDPNPDSPTESVTARVETVEDVVRVLLGLGDSDAIAATESIATTANTAATTAISGALEESGSIAQAIAAAEGRVKVTTDALQGAIDTLNGSETTTGSVAKAVADAEGRVKVTTDALAGRIAALEGVKLSVQVVDALPEVPVINTIYLVPEEGSTTGTYVEYIAYKPEGSETVITERIGTTAVDLEGYTTDEEYDALAGETGRVTVVEGKVKTLEETTIPAIQKSVTDGVSEAKTYAEEQASAAQSAAESTAAGELAAAVEQIGKDIEAAKNAAIASAEVTITAGTGIVVTPEGKGTTFEISVSDAVATASDLTALTTRVTTLETTTVPGIDTRLQAAEATITSLTEEGGVIDGIESEIAALAGEEGRVTELEGKVSDIETSLAEGGAIANAIKAAQDTADAKVASVTVTDTTGTITTGGSATAPAFTVTGGAISDTETKFVSGSTVKTYVDGQISNAKSEIKGTTDALAQDIQSIKDVIGEGENGENIIDILSGIRTELDATTATANSAAQSAEGDTYVSASQTDTKITVTTNIAAITSHVDTELVKTGTAVATAISGVQTAVEGKSLASTSTGSDLVTVTTTGTVGTGMTTTVDTTALATAISDAESNAISAAEAAAKAMTLSATDTDDAGKVTVTLGGTVETPTITVTTDDIASASTLSDLVNTVNTHIAEAAGLYLSVEKVDTLPSDAEAKTNKIYLVPVDTEAGREQNIHTEYIWTNNKWEIIGTTAIDINSLEAAAEAAQSTADTALANAATAQAAADKAQGEVDALEEVVATKANASEVISSITDGKGTTVTGAVTVKDGRETVTENDLWGTTATMSEDGVLTIAHDWVTNPNASK